MATSNRVFVSPGVYTSEKDLTFVAQSVGVTTLGLVGETLKGPAFEPVLITNFDEFKTYFGSTSPSKDGNGNPKYELPYVAKSYLQESNQLFVTRILGLTGYKPDMSYGVKTLGGVVIDNLTGYTSTSNTLIPTATGITGSTFYADLTGKTSIDGTSLVDYIVDNFSAFGTGNTGNWFVIGKVPDIAIPTGNTEYISPITGKLNEESTYGKEWYNYFYSTTGATIDGVYAYKFVFGTSDFTVTQYKYTASVNSDYDGVVVLSMRSRGKYVGQTLNLELTDPSSLVLSNVDDLSVNPLGEFNLTVTGLTSGVKTFTCSLDSTSNKFVSKVLGLDVYDKSYDEIPVYVFEVYPNLLKNAFNKGYVRGLDITPVVNTEGTEFMTQWDTAASPMVVSEVRGGEVSELFQIVTISDGDASNTQVKIMIQNVDLDTGEFDLVVRDFNDTDDNMVVLEKFTRCSMNPDLPGYVAKKIGTSDTEYDLRSKYIMLVMADNHPTDAFPAGFKGFTTNDSFNGATLGSVIYKTQYYDAGDEIYYESNGTPVTSNGDKVRKVSLGLSSQDGHVFDSDLFRFKGKTANGTSYGFHLSVNAATITGGTPSGYMFKTTPYDLEGTDKGDLESIAYRKFTFAVCGGFDGWDIYRKSRTYGDGYIFNKSTYNSGNTTNGGVFSTTVGNSDYYSYLQGINTFSNPEAVDINVFATPGIDWFNNSSLVQQAIDMVENDRADSLYIVNAPGPQFIDDASEIVGELDAISIDSNYSATYWPWIQVRDTDNATQLYLPPTGEVLKNIALTDNVSYPWFAVAGYSRGLVNSIKAFKKLTLDERDDLYKNRVNPIATFADTGTIIWGNKTLQVRESALDRINVRRLLLRARKLISAVAVRLLFEQNDEQVRNEFLRLVNPILEAIKKERGLTEFRVTVSNDPEDIDSNTLRGKIYIKPTRSLEFIDVEFIITPTGASFENI
jgi:hypothetical protein